MWQAPQKYSTTISVSHQWLHVVSHASPSATTKFTTSLVFTQPIWIYCSIPTGTLALSILGCIDTNAAPTAPLSHRPSPGDRRPPAIDRPCRRVRATMLARAMPPPPPRDSRPSTTSHPLPPRQSPCRHPPQPSRCRPWTPRCRPRVYLRRGPPRRQSMSCPPSPDQALHPPRQRLRPGLAMRKARRQRRARRKRRSLGLEVTPRRLSLFL